MATKSKKAPAKKTVSKKAKARPAEPKAKAAAASKLSLKGIGPRVTIGSPRITGPRITIGGTKFKVGKKNISIKVGGNTLTLGVPKFKTTFSSTYTPPKTLTLEWVMVDKDAYVYIVSTDPVDLEVGVQVNGVVYSKLVKSNSKELAWIFVNTPIEKAKKKFKIVAAA